MFTIRKYPAKRWVIKKILCSLDGCAVPEEGVYWRAYLKNEPFPSIPSHSLTRALASRILSEIPLAVLSSPFIPKPVKLSIRSLSKRAVKETGDRIERLPSEVASRLEEKRPLLYLFYLDVGRMKNRPESTRFVDSLVLEVTDLVLEEIPAGLFFVKSGRVRRAAYEATRLASKVRAQISPDVVQNFTAFRKDLLALDAALFNLEFALGNSPLQFSGYLDAKHSGLSRKVLQLFDAE